MAFWLQCAIEALKVYDFFTLKTTFLNCNINTFLKGALQNFFFQVKVDLKNGKINF